ncbi:glycosyltransferase [Marinomonas flavescens]|uniref:glycosyltransferase n=1 Tax=Marinomonas flavescens TaxID=2529379 RepID=UPI0010552C30|nr:glycosyltransferase [Marinomonas flavescens]
MKILLLGEYSAFHKNLKEGLVELGYDAVVAAHGDGFKKVPCDISFTSSLPSLFGKLSSRLTPLCKLDQLTGYDVVQLINPFAFGRGYFFERFFLQKIIDGNEKFFLSGAGDDAFFWKYGRKALEYGPFDDFLKYDLNSDRFYMETDKAFDFNKRMLEKSNGLIPIMYEYEKSYEGQPKRLNTIPIPMNMDKIVYEDNKLGKKLVVFHGLNRYGFKGTRHVEEAFEYLGNKYPNDLELVIDGKMPLNEYLQLMRRTNVVIDQMNSYSLGVNGIYALAMGKVVLGGVEPESLISLGVESSPVINLKPNAQSIIQQVENLLERKNEIQKLGYESRQFAENVHGHIKVAQQYIETWGKY